MRPEDLSVVVCTKDRPEQLRLVLLGLATQDVWPGEVVVSDSGELSAVAVVDELRRPTGPALRYVRRPVRGFEASATRNAGAAVASGRWLLFMDGDCVPLPGVVGGHLRKAGDARRVLVGGFVRLDPARSSEVTPSRIAARTLDRFVRPEELRRLRWMHRKGRLYEMVRHPKRPALSSGHFSLAASAFRAINGFDENYVGWGQEDDDLRERLFRWGARTHSLLGSALCLHVYHERDPTALKRWREGINVPYLMRKDRPVRCINGLVMRSR